MAYGNYYGAPYYQQPNYYNGAAPDMLNQIKGQYQPQMAQQQMPIISGGLLYVENEEQAKNYLVAPNNVVPMFDKNKPILYVKGSDGAGMPNFKKYTIAEFVESDLETPKNPPQHVCQCGKDFVKIDDFKSLEAKFEDLQGKVEVLLKPKTTKSKGDEEDA